MGSDLVGLGPVGAERAQQQTGHDALALPEGRQRAQQGEQRVGAGVKQVVVAEDAQRHVLGPARAQRHRPGLLALFEAERALLRLELVDAGLGVVGCDLAAHDLVVVAARQERDAILVAGQFEREGLGHGDGAEQVLDGEDGALA